MSEQPTCAESINEHYAGRLEDLRALVAAVNVSELSELEDLSDEDLRTITDIGWVREDPAGLQRKPEWILAPVVRSYDENGDLESLTVGGDEIIPDELAESARERLDDYGLGLSVKTVVRWELSTGGPADWFEIEVDEGDIGAVTYHFADWFDHAERPARDAEDVVDAAVGEYARSLVAGLSEASSW